MVSLRTPEEAVKQVNTVDAIGVGIATGQPPAFLGRRGGKPLSPKSIDNYLGVLIVLLNFAVRKKWITVSPMGGVDLPKTRGDAPLDELTFLEPHEVARLIANARPDDYHTLDRALYTLAAYTGLRQGELRGLRWEHVDIGRCIIHVLENVTRGRRSSLLKVGDVVRVVIEGIGELRNTIVIEPDGCLAPAVEPEATWVTTEA